MALPGLFLLLMLQAATVSQQEVQRAQAEMLNRVLADIRAYVAEIALDGSYATYCFNKMALDKSRAPDGMVPFKVDYNTIADRDELETVLHTREVFERSYMKLCLTDAKRTLKSAK